MPEPPERPDHSPVGAVLLKPMLRGWSHVLAFATLLVLGGWMIADAVGTRRGPGLIIIYVAGTGAMFGVSSAYHRLHWSPDARVLMSKLDHCTSFWRSLVRTPRWQSSSCTTGIGGPCCTRCGSAPPSAFRCSGYRSDCHVGRSSLCTSSLVGQLRPRFGELYSGLGPLGFTRPQRGLAYTVGALIYARKRPDPWPLVFGYHEVFRDHRRRRSAYAAMAEAVLPKF